jgi:hypothetical protein
VPERCWKSGHLLFVSHKNYLAIKLLTIDIV